MTPNEPFSLCFIRRHFSLYGGAERYLSRLIETLGSRYDQHVIAERWEDVPHMTLHRVSKHRWRGVKRFAMAVETILARNAFDVVFSLERTVGQDIYRAGDGVHREWLNIKRQHLRGNWMKEWLNPKNREILTLERQLFAQTPVIIANSQMVKRNVMQHYGVPEQRIQVIYNGVVVPDIASRDELRTQVLTEARIPSDRPIFTYVGSGFERKGVGLFLQGLALLKAPCHAFIVGKGDLRPYQKLARTLGIEQRVTFTGPVKEPALYYAAANLFVLPTYYDPFSNTCLEAASWGTAVLTSSNNGASELLHNAGVLEHFTPEELANKMEPFLDHTRAREHGAQARCIAEEFSIESNVEQTIAVIQAVIASKQRGVCV
ncbi:glycosyltransferase family 4 protein [Chrysiogenes arsenatis]|uniref:glycosyltransferase family 4 protein n=1 Tax=Chrysiogenes arsenatis TaxID=309797 RepID=UPI0003F54D40|nr:glycosyltransferase family 4 protein [Chrysiogenes arsenatis]